MRVTVGDAVGAHQRHSGRQSPGRIRKCIGETEKNLARLFERAERTEAVLLFDEADSLFGNRTDGRDANDRFANAPINYLLQKIFTDKELEEKSVIQFFRITAADGKIYDTGHYNLSAVIAVGYKVNSERAVQFRKWATGIIESFTIKGFAMDDERLKNDGSVLGKKYFEEQLQRVREIRLSERKFYQKITDLYATALDYDVTAAASLPDSGGRMASGNA